mgnify:CR=1 FL=1
MASLNKCEFIGNLGKDPEMRYMPNGNAVASITVACSESWKDKNTGEKVEHTEWVNCTAFGKLAEIMEKYLKKGSKVYVSGKMKTDKYQDKETGKDKYSTKIIANEMIMLDSKGVADTSDAQQQAPAKQDAPAMSGG